MDAAQLLRPAPNPRIPRFSPGDTVRVNFRIREGNRERIQAFQGVVIRFQNGKGPAANFTVRRISAGIGIERIFPLYSPLIESLEITRYGSVRRAKLYYLRGLQGRAARIKELNPLQRRRAIEAAQAAAEQAVVETGPVPDELTDEEIEAALLEEAELEEAEAALEAPVDEVEAVEEGPETVADEAPVGPAEDPASDEPADGPSGTEDEQQQ